MPTGDDDDQVFEFGDFMLSPKERLLLHAGEPVSVAAKAFDLLVALVRRSGHLVGKDELLREVWPDTFVQEVNLTVNISALRKALRRGGTDDDPIRTVSAHGYRFVAPVIARNATVTHRVGRVTTENTDAYRAYLQGRHHWSQRSEEALKRATEHFQYAIALDPWFAAAYAGLADCYATMGSLSHLAPMNAFLVLTGMETLPLRMRRHCDNALVVAQWLEADSRVEWVNYAGLEKHKLHAAMRKYCPKGAGSVFTFGLKGGYEAGVKLVNSVRIFSHLANIGDTRSLIIHPASTTHRQLSDEDRVKAGAGPEVVRLSVGIEDPKDLIADLDQAMAG